MAILTKAYLYKIGRKGGFETHKGLVKISESETDRAEFFSDNGRKMYCALYSGDVYENCVWYEKENKKVASQVLIKWCKNKINELEERIHSQQKKIEELESYAK